MKIIDLTDKERREIVDIKNHWYYSLFSLLISGPLLGCLIALLFWLFNGSFWNGFILGIIISLFRRALVIITDYKQANLELTDEKKVVVQTDNYIIDATKCVIKLTDNNEELKLRSYDLAKKFDNKPITIEYVRASKRVIFLLPDDF